MQAERNIMSSDLQATVTSHAAAAAGRFANAIDPNPFAGLRIAITGGTSGLGLALVKEFMRY